MGVGRRRKDSIILERAGRETSPSRGQKTPHLKSELAESDFRGRENRAFPRDPS